MNKGAPNIITINSRQLSLVSAILQETPNKRSADSWLLSARLCFVLFIYFVYPCHSLMLNTCITCSLNLQTRENKIIKFGWPQRRASPPTCCQSACRLWCLGGGLVSQVCLAALYNRLLPGGRFPSISVVAAASVKRPPVSRPRGAQGRL